jgi:hypothetical protein
MAPGGACGVSTTAYSPGWRARIVTGSGQARMLEQLERAKKHPSRTWHDAPKLRAFGISPGTAHRTIHRLAALGLIAIQTTLGRDGGVRFTSAVRFWRRKPIDRRNVRRMLEGRIAPGQLAFAHTFEPDPPVYRVIPDRPMPKDALGECQLCGALERVRIGLYRLEPRDQIRSGPRCVDHAACDARRAAE